METLKLIEENKEKVLKEIEEIVKNFNLRIKQEANTQKIILELQELRAIYLKKYGIDIHDYVVMYFNDDLSLNCLIFKIKNKKKKMEKEFKFKMSFKMGDEITAKGKDEEEAKINALTEMGMNLYDYLELEKI